MIKNFCCGVLSLGLLTSCDSTAQNASTETTTNHQTTENMEDLKSIAEQAQAAFFKDYSEEDVRKLFNADYIQHNPYVPTGLEPVIGLLPALAEAKTTYTTYRLLQDGDFIIFHNAYHNAEAFGAKEMIAFDIWRMENGRVAEHWDNITPKVEETASGRSQIDGPTTITDLDKTDANKALVKQFVNDVLFGKAPEKITSYISAEHYHQHNPAIKDGLEGLNEAIAFLAANDNMFEYHKVHMLLGEGNFVLAVSEGTWNGKPQAFYDLFRLESGKIVEHWDVVAEIPEQMAHDNGKF